jgi:DNA-binding XRE family transcriptional regulator
VVRHTVVQVTGHAVNNRLRELRAVRRWSQADLADHLDVSRQTINAVETGRYEVAIAEMQSPLVSTSTTLYMP